uniref:Papain-like cysteine peptidase (DUF1796) n=1 Tax=Candidatus Kentrum sp. UNK TaxID=2126344 RepID=A0A451APW0_9GAMM|nr:MAG: Putative papain-like cysteine peptidase (DUF1796) [Candidatus Kentron sp. UNK]VFK73328.1 MAG: Putative papain-like cysteine peptidase (DUF1796) [Candidatus Kentron sp. UNK]
MTEARPVACNIAQDRPAGHVDAVISLGSFCQVGGILWLYDIKDTNSPFDNFGFRTWTSIIPILRNRFADYWLEENMEIGDPVEDYSGPNNAKRLTIIVWCKRYNVENTHHFSAEKNTPDELEDYPRFREKVARMERAFLKRCKLYDNIRFVCKAMNSPEFEDTEVRKEDVLELLEVLAKVREGKPFTLALAVPEKPYEALKAWVIEERIPNLHIAKWTIHFNDTRNEEWEDLLRGVTVPENRYERVWNEIYADDRPEKENLLQFNSTYV